MKQLDLITIFIASIIYTVLYVCWYSKFLFGKFVKKTKTKVKTNKQLSYFFTFLTIFVAAYVLSVFEILVMVTSFWDGVVLGFIIWFGFVGTHNLFLVINKKRTFKEFAIDNALYLLGLMIIGGILAG